MPRTATATVGTIEETTIHKRLIEPEAPGEAEQVPSRSTEPKPDCFQWMLLQTDEDWKHLLAYLYRRDGNSRSQRGRMNLKAYTKPFTAEDVKEEFGGNDNQTPGEFYEVMITRDNKFAFSDEFRLPGPAKGAPGSPAPAAAVNGGMDPAVKVLFDFMKEQMAELRAQLSKQSATPAGPDFGPAMALMTTAFNQSMQLVMKTAQTQIESAIKPAGADAITGKLIEAALAKIMNPGNPFEMLTAALAAFGKLKEQNLIGDLGAAASGEVSWPVVVAQNLDKVVAAAEGPLSEIRKITELRVLGQPPMPPPGARVPPMRPPAPAVNPTPPGMDEAIQQPEEPEPGPPARAVVPLETERASGPIDPPPPAGISVPIEWVKAKVVEQINDVDEEDRQKKNWVKTIAEDVAYWLYRTDDNLLEQLAAAPVEQLVYLFTSDPILSQAQIPPEDRPLFAEKFKAWAMS